MDVSDLYRTDGDDAVVVHLHVQPGAGRSAVVGRHGTALKVRVAAPPEQGRANAALAALLSETFGVAASAVEVVGGLTSRSKEIRITGVDQDEFKHRLAQVVADAPVAGPAGRGRGSATRGIGRL